MQNSLMYLSIRMNASHALLPYTTLFRSWDPPGKSGYCRCHRRAPLVLGKIHRRSLDPENSDRFHWECRDRKSTRLNSSHQIISYAVFCLKKKKKTKTAVSN